MPSHDGADHVLLVNSDCFVPPDCLDRLVAALERNARCGHRRTRRPLPIESGPVASLGMSYTPFTGRMWNRGAGRRVARVRRPADAIVDGVSGCLMLVRREVFDADWLARRGLFFQFRGSRFLPEGAARRIHDRVASDAVAYHEGSRSIGADSPTRLYFGARNHLLMAERADPASGSAAASASLRSCS